MVDVTYITIYNTKTIILHKISCINTNPHEDHICTRAHTVHMKYGMDHPILLSSSHTLEIEPHGCQLSGPLPSDGVDYEEGVVTGIEGTHEGPYRGAPYHVHWDTPLLQCLIMMVIRMMMVVVMIVIDDDGGDADGINGNDSSCTF
jgi:hypothetical protein